jgi:hypothetical protein
VKRKGVSLPTTPVAAERVNLEERLENLEWMLKEVVTLVRLLYASRKPSPNGPPAHPPTAG